MDKAEVANVLEEIGTILELQGENRFRTQAYLKAARAIAQLDVSLADLVAQDKLETIPGIGATLKDKITTLVTTGRLAFHEELRARMSPGLILLLRLPGIGPKKVKTLYDKIEAAVAQVAQQNGIDLVIADGRQDITNVEDVPPEELRRRPSL